jgi:2-aminoadipate transaminase
MAADPIDLLAQRMKWVGSSAIMELVKRAGTGGFINFASGLPDASLFPDRELQSAAEHVLSLDSAGALQYGPTEGYAPLRDWIAQRLRGFGLRATPESILITNGSEQALDLCARAFLNPGDHVCVESPTYAAALQTFTACEVRYQTIQQDEEGLNVEAAQDALRSGCKLLYTLPNFQNPSGRTLSADRREKLAEAIGASGAILIEDDAYHDLLYEGEDLPPVASLAEGGAALYLGSFSKSIAPGLRVGYVHGPAPVIERLSHLKQISDLHTSSLSQRLVFRFVSEGHFEPHLEKLTRAYRAKRDRMLAALDQSMPAGVHWTHPLGGMFLWLTLPESMDAEKLLDCAIDRKLLFVPGGGFCADSTGRNAIRLNFVSATPTEIDQGITILADLVRTEERDGKGDVR